MKETDLYPPLKAFFEGLGYIVKAEIGKCDLVAQKDGAEPVIVELKTSFSIALLLQGVDRLSLSDSVYLAIPMGTGKRWAGSLRDARKLCRRLGLGLISVRLETGLVNLHAEPGPYAPRKSWAKADRLKKEFMRRQGDPNIGGQTRTKIMTAYRQDALRLVAAMGEEPRAVKDLRAETGVANAGPILSKDYYGWFYRVARGAYMLSDAGIKAREAYAAHIAELSG